MLVEDRVIVGISRSGAGILRCWRGPVPACCPGRHPHTRRSSVELELARQMVEENPASALQAMSIAIRMGSRRSVISARKASVTPCRLARCRTGGHGQAPGPVDAGCGSPIRSTAVSGEWSAAQHQVPRLVVEADGAAACRGAEPTVAYGIDCLKIYVERFDGPSARRIDTW